MDSAPSVSWLRAYPPLVILATNAMAQPAGRLLDMPAVHSMWLRISPVLCALDAIALIVRCAVYCAVLQASPRQALLIAGAARFPAEDAESNGDLAESEAAVERDHVTTTTRLATIAKSVTSHTMRLAVFALGVFSLVELALAPGGRAARWTAAWGWMFVLSYVVVEAPAQVYRWELATPQYTAADFELDDVEAGLVGGGRGSRRNSHDGDHDRDDASSTAGASEAGSHKDETTEGGHEETNNLLSSEDLAHDLERNEAPAGNAAAKPPPYKYSNDPASDPRLLGINNKLGKLEFYCLNALGLPLSFGLLYWAFLDLVQPVVNAEVLAVDVTNGTGWDNATAFAEPVYYLSMLIMFLVLVGCIIAALCIGVLAFHVFQYINKNMLEQMPESLRQISAVTTTVTVSSYVLGGLSVILGCYAGSPLFIRLMLSPHLYWVYGMLSVDLIVFLLFFVGCFVVFLSVKAGVVAFRGKFGTPVATTLGESTAAAPSSRTAVSAYVAHVVRQMEYYLSEEGIVMMSVVVIVFIISYFWYRYRFAASAHWLQDWRDALVANVTAPANATIDNATETASAAASSVPAPVFLFE